MRAASVRLGVCDLDEQPRAIGAAAAGASAARVEHRAEVGERAEREGRDGGGAAVEQPDIVPQHGGARVGDGARVAAAAAAARVRRGLGGGRARVRRGVRVGRELPKVLEEQERDGDGVPAEVREEDEEGGGALGLSPRRVPARTGDGAQRGTRGATKGAVCGAGGEGRGGGCACAAARRRS